MPASELSPGRYVAMLAAAAALLVAAVALLNLTMDPYSLASGRWYRLRDAAFDDVADRVPDGGNAARAHAVAASDSPILLLGTSRVQVGFETPPAAFNAGQPAATLEELLRIMAAAGARAQPPRLYAVELSNRLRLPFARRAALAADYPGPGVRFLATSTTHVSVHLLGHLGGQRRPGHARSDFFLALPARKPPPRKVVADPDVRTAFEQVGSEVEAMLAGDLRRMMAICARSGSALLLFEAPVHPDLLSDRRAMAEVRRRIALYRSVRRRLAPLFPSCRSAVADFSGAPGSIPVAGAELRANWFNALHFLPPVGASLLQRIEPMMSPAGAAPAAPGGRAGGR
ncbi:hypothetical protein [Sphingosinicella sp. BN140058]|uniref:hypothetical protein n=1 Tax=Sphingosinicella sp. BN140058 TaxID=1892855 RepID=UPI0010126F00|nr:hypothetical protein [Sphingosinicella sp. BN140058]QAY77818.1 hypothetical protein ETR14_15800 [Sphingosinicella sp. BN140058]